MKKIAQHIGFIFTFIMLLALFSACSSTDENQIETTEEQTQEENPLSGLEEKYEQQPSMLKRFLKKYSRKGIREAQNATVGTKNISKLRKINRYYKKIGRQLDTGGDIVDAKLASQNVLREGVEVFGWHPHYMGSAYESYNFNLLTTIAYFSYDVNPETGGYRSYDPIRDWKRTPMIDSAHAKGCDVLLTITNHGKNNNRVFLNNLTAQQNLIDSLITLLELRQADGINIDFENLPSGVTGQMTQFVQTLGAVLTQINSKYKITIALPAVDHTNAFDIEALLPVVDRFVIMGYDYHSGASKKPGAVAPLPPKGKKISGFNLQNTVDDYLDAGLPQSKMIMAFPYYGRVWEGSNASFSDGRFTQALTYRVIKSNYEPFYEMKYDSNTTSYYFNYLDTMSNQYVECWYDNEISLGKKYDWVNKQKLRGIGIWALGYDNGYTEMWSLIDEKFAGSEEIIAAKEPWLPSFLSRNGLYMTSGIAFMILFMFAGLAAALLKQEVSHQLFTKRWFLNGFLFVSMIFLLLWIYFMGWANGVILFFFGGLWLGYLLINYMERLKISTHSDLP